MIANGSNPRPQSVLIVDDDPLARLLALRALSEMGFKTEEAADGHEALDCIEAAVPDLVLLDLDMPGLDGFETCESIRASERTRELPVLIATGLTDGATIDRAYEVGATDFLKKPLDLSILRHHVRFVLRAHAAFNDLRETLSELEASDRRLEGAQKLAHVGHWEWQPDANDMLWSAETFRILGIEPHAEPPTLDAFLRAVHPEDRAEVERLMRRSAVEQQAWNSVHRVRTRKNDIRIVHQHATVSISDTDRCVAGTVQDVTERKRAQDQMEFLAHYDGLTALPNRKLLRERLDRLVARARRDNQVLGVIRLDLDRFKRVNDTLGHNVGDELLRAVARHLQRCVRTTDPVARSEEEEVGTVSSLGGDEFSIVLTHVRSADDLSYVSQRILDSFRLPFESHGHQIEMTASLGVALFPGDGDDTEKLLRSAGAALNHAKQAGGAAFHFFDNSMNELADRRMQIEMGLGSAVERGELRLVYQPKWDATTRRVTGMEVLLRWRSDELGDVSPSEFIPIAENANLIQRLGEWVFEQACQQLQNWREEGLALVPLAVNFSSRQLNTPAVAILVTRIMQNSEVDPALMEIEMTESAFVGNADEVLAVLNSLKETGVRIALDDFGTGYSSISHLARFPIDVLKIDRSFVSKIGEDNRQSSTLVSALIALARRLALTVVAEGVETDMQAAFLRDEGCHTLQGYALAKPLELEEATALLVSQAASHTTTES